MKQQILEILTGVADVHDPIFTELERLMCYREVRAFWVCNCTIGGVNVTDTEAWEQLREYLSGYYPEEIILQAIEKVKKEQA